MKYGRIIDINIDKLLTDDDHENSRKIVFLFFVRIYLNKENSRNEIDFYFITLD